LRRREAKASLFVLLREINFVEISEIRRVIEDYLENSDKYLVEATLRPDNKIVVEIDSDRSVSIDDCVALSKHIEAHFDCDIGNYELEVGSAGIAQPLKTLRQYKKNVGNEVETLLKDGKKYAGILKDADENKFILTIEKQVKPEGAKRKITQQEDVTFTYNEIKYTKNIIRFK
jgi:ribosome maturation factor RimP